MDYSIIEYGKLLFVSFKVVIESFQAIFYVTDPVDVYLVARLERQFQCSVTQGVEQYLKEDAKTAQSIQKKIESSQTCTLTFHF